MSDKNGSAWVLPIAMVFSAAVGLFSICGVFQFVRMVWAAVVN